MQLFIACLIRTWNILNYLPLLNNFFVTLLCWHSVHPSPDILSSMVNKEWGVIDIKDVNMCGIRSYFRLHQCNGLDASVYSLASANYCGWHAVVTVCIFFFSFFLFLHSPLSLFSFMMSNLQIQNEILQVSFSNNTKS